MNCFDNENYACRAIKKQERKRTKTLEMRVGLKGEVEHEHERPRTYVLSVPRAPRGVLSPNERGYSIPGSW